MAIRVSSPTSITYNGPGGASGQDRVNAARTEMYGLARGQVGALQNDAVDQEILSALRARATGGTLPYDQATKDALFSQQAQMNDARQTAERDRLSRSGVSANDPAFQAQMRANQARSDAAMQQARLGVNTQANLANYAAQGQALGQTAGFNQMRNQGIMGAQDRLMGLLSREEATVGSPMPGGSMTRTRSNPTVSQPMTLLPSGAPQGIAPGTVVTGTQPRYVSNQPASTGNMQWISPYMAPQQQTTAPRTSLPPTAYAMPGDQEPTGTQPPRSTTQGVRFTMTPGY